MIYVLGSLNIDLVFRVPHVPQPGETVIGADVATFPGGKGANQAVAAARLGATVQMIGQIGGDAHAELLLASLRAAGVDRGGIGGSSHPTGLAVIAVDEQGENAIVVSPGSNASLTPELARERLRAIGANDILLCQLEIPRETVEQAVRFAKEQGARTILNPAPAPVSLPAELLEGLDWITPNQHEYAALESELRDAPVNVAITLGAAGCRLIFGGKSIGVPGFPLQALDTTAAGDVWNGAFAVGLLEGNSPEEAARWANAAAALSVTRSGAQTSAPELGEVREFLAAQASNPDG